LPKWYADLAPALADNVLQANDVVSVSYESDAEHLTRSVWESAKNELLVSTRSGDWIERDKKLKGIVEDKCADSDFKLWVLLASPDYLRTHNEKEKIGANERLRGYLKELRTPVVLSYEPETTRMNIADGQRAQVFIWPPHMGDAKVPSYTFFSGNPSVSAEFAEMFFVKSLTSADLVGPNPSPDKPRIVQELGRRIRNKALLRSVRPSRR